MKEACGPAHLKVILETGELETFDNVRTRVDAGHGLRCQLHQDFYRQNIACSDHVAGDAGDARGDPRISKR